MSIYRFIFYRLLQMLAVILGTITVLFVVIYLLVPGDPAQVMLGTKATPQLLDNLRHELGLDHPIWSQYLLYIWRLIHLDLGMSYQLNRSVTGIIFDYLPATMYLAGAAVAIEAVVGVAWGSLLAAKRSPRLEILFTIPSAILLAMPVFFLALMLQYIFGSRLHLLPLSGLGGYNPVYLLLPAVTLAATQTIIISVITRSSLEAEISKTYFLAARARGLSFGQTLIRHGFRNALGPVITLLALDLGSLMGGAIIVETVYSWPGIGRMTYFAAQSRDIPLILGAVIFLVVVFVTLNSAVDVLYGVLNPKIRWTGADR